MSDEETVHDFISDIKELLNIPETDISRLYPKREDGGSYDSLKKTGWRRVRDRIRQMNNRIEYLEDQQEEIEKMVRTGKASCEISNKKVLEDVETLIDQEEQDDE